MQINNSARNVSFGARWISSNHLLEFTKNFNPSITLRANMDIKNTGCKNSLISSNLDSLFCRSGQGCCLKLSFPRHSDSYVLTNAENIRQGKLPETILAVEQRLLTDTMYKATVDGNLDKVTKDLLEDLPELTQDIEGRYHYLKELSETIKETPQALPVNKKSFWEKLKNIVGM